VIQALKIPSPNPNPRGRKRGEKWNWRGAGRGRRERQSRGTRKGWEAALVLVPGARGEREGRDIYGAHAAVQNTLGLKLETKRP